ncbi:hypothetical protein NE237_004654 [Protea cynaroides]|uniref:RNase H type-1 domain-containing protein n=1 Tax=Protea cynaroides TaxID=273540 RepID=A0A9Q0KJD4_9MAGN|nr:hypothetical protein NE237_004654 [Protea cynaroides]
MIREKKSDARMLFCKASFICWHLWLARNDLLFQKKERSTTEVLNHALSAFMEFSDIHFPQLLPTIEHSIYTLKYPNDRQSLDGFLVINTDTCLLEDRHLGGIGFSWGTFGDQLSKAYSRDCVFQSVIEGEALAVCEALVSAVEAAYDLILIKSTIELDEMIKSLQTLEVEIRYTLLNPLSSTCILFCSPLSMICHERSSSSPCPPHLGRKASALPRRTQFVSKALARLEELGLA